MKPSEFIKKDIRERRLDCVYEEGTLEELDEKFIDKKRVIDVIEKIWKEHYDKDIIKEKLLKELGLEK